MLVQQTLLDGQCVPVCANMKGSSFISPLLLAYSNIRLNDYKSFVLPAQTLRGASLGIEMHSSTG